MDAEEDGEGILTTLIRKMAHFFCYLILGILGMWTLSAYNAEGKRWLIALLFCMLYAVSDEVHQLFVPGRAGKIVDVLIDTAGSATGIAAFSIAKSREKNVCDTKRG